MTSDQVLELHVREELEMEPSVKAEEIGIAVIGGTVTLMGCVHSFPEKWNAEEAVKRVVGLQGLANELEVRLLAAGERSDTDIVQTAIQFLNWDVRVPFELVKVKMENGWITLVGEVNTYAQRQAAEEDVRNLAGVKGITNLISIKPPVKPIEVEAQIKKAFTRRAELDAQHITVCLQNETVILQGKVRSWAQREEAEGVAWKAHGVTKVENYLVVAEDDN